MAKFILTITGADDSVDPTELVKLSEQYPFVEWAILFTATAMGKDRYPTLGWRNSLIGATMDTKTHVGLAAHICGSFVDERLRSKEYLTTEIEMFYRRVQFNRFNHENLGQVLEYSDKSSSPVILPCSTKTKPLLDLITDKSRLQVLFDNSGGRGVFINEFPDPPKDFHLCGYAGGVDENNIESVLAQLGVKFGSKPFWVDLESGARTNDKFDLAKVKRILEKANKYTKESTLIVR